MKHYTVTVSVCGSVVKVLKVYAPNALTAINWVESQVNFNDTVYCYEARQEDGVK